MAFIQTCIDYCKANPILAGIAGGLVLALLLLCIIIPCVAVSRKKKRARAESAKQAEVSVTTEEPVEEPVEEIAEVAEVEEVSEVAEVEETPAVEEPVQEETVEEFVEEAVAEEPVTEEKTEAPAPIKEEKAEDVPVVEEKVEVPVVEEKVEVPVVEEKPQAVKKEVEKEISVAEAKASKPAKKQVQRAPAPVETKKTEEVKAKSEAKEKEQPTVAKSTRYAGKWIVYRMVTQGAEADTENEEYYFFELHASNGEKLLSSEEYTSYAGALRGIDTHKKNILAGNFRTTLSKKGQYIFKLLNSKGTLLCTGENYSTKARCIKAIESTKRFAETANVEEKVQEIIIKLPPEDDTPIAPLPENCTGKWIISSNTDEDGETVYFFELFANNKEKLLSSEEYSSYAGALNGIETHKKNIAAGNFRIVLTKRGEYIYKLLNASGQLLCLGEHYKTRRRCQNAVESVKRFAASSSVAPDPNNKQE